MKHLGLVIGFLSFSAILQAQQEVPLDEYLSQQGGVATMAATDSLIEDVERALMSDNAPLEESVLLDQTETTSTKPFMDFEDENFDAILKEALRNAHQESTSEVKKPVEEENLVVREKTGKMLKYPFARLSILNKISGKLEEIKVKVGESTPFERLDVKVHSCQVRPPEMQPEEGVALQIFENFRDRRERIFSGWMFKVRKSVSTMEHPLYDVWLQGCVMPEVEKEAPAKKADDKKKKATGSKKDQQKKADKKAPPKKVVAEAKPKPAAASKPKPRRRSRPSLEAVY